MLNGLSAPSDDNIAWLMPPIGNSLGHLKTPNLPGNHPEIRSSTQSSTSTQHDVQLAVLEARFEEQGKQIDRIELGMAGLGVLITLIVLIFSIVSWRQAGSVVTKAIEDERKKLDDILAQAITATGIAEKARASADMARSKAEAAAASAEDCALRADDASAKAQGNLKNVADAASRIAELEKALVSRGVEDTSTSVSRSDARVVLDAADEIVSRPVAERTAADFRVLALDAHQRRDGRELLSLASTMATNFSNEPEEVAWALSIQAMAFRMMGQLDNEIKTYDEFVQRFDSSEIPALKTQVIEALFNKAFTLAEKDLHDDAIDTYNKAISKFGDNSDSTIQELVAKILFWKAMSLRNKQLNDDAITLLDEICERFKHDSRPGLLERVAGALFWKAMTLRKQGKIEDANAVFGEVKQRFGEESSGPLQERVAMALVEKGACLRALKRNDEALSVFDEVIRNFGDSSNPILQTEVARAFFNKGNLFVAKEQSADAASSYDEVIRRFSNSASPTLQELVENARTERTKCQGSEG